MSYSTLFSLAFGILSSLMLREVTALKWPLPSNSGPHRFTWGEFPRNTQEIPRSLDLEDFTLNVAPTSGRVSSPTIVRLHPIVSQSYKYATLPMRFGRDAQASSSDRAPKSNIINLPQRFGRSCTICARSGIGPSATLPQRFGRRNAFTIDLNARTAELPSPKDRSLPLHMDLDKDGLLSLFLSQDSSQRLHV
nr:pro-FMRFamide-related neuropeptide VF isoform X1 [Misgurnus anguillicaudatus]